MLRQGVQRWAYADGADAALEGPAARIPLRRIGRPEEIVEAILSQPDRPHSAVTVANGT